jgi:hypothetical protein
MRILFLGIALAACSGGSSQTDVENPTPGDGETEQPTAVETEPEPVSPEEKFKGQQQTTCQAMCERVTDCAVEDARANMSAEELAKLDLENTVPKAVQECTEECVGKELSPRQVTVIRECLAEPTECNDFLTCLEQAQRRG